MVQFELVDACNDDYDFVYRLKKIVLQQYIEDTWGWDEAFQLKFHRQHFHTDNTKIILVNNNQAGTVDVREEANCLFISGLYLLPEYQSRGIGSSIIEAIEKQAKSKLKNTELEVLKVNVRAQNLYTQLGFEVAGVDDTKLRMRK